MVTASGCTAGTMGAPCPPGGDSALRCPRRRAGRQATEPNHDRPDGSPRADRPLERGRGRRSAPSLPPAVRAALSPLPGVRRRNRTMTDGWLTMFGPPTGTRAGTAQRAVPTSRRARGAVTVAGRQATEPNHDRRMAHHVRTARWNAGGDGAARRPYLPPCVRRCHRCRACGDGTEP